MTKNDKVYALSFIDLVVGKYFLRLLKKYFYI